MSSYINLNVRDFYTFQGRIGRIDFIIGVVLTSSVPAILYYASRGHVLALGNGTFYFGFKTFLHLLGLSLVTPFYVKRFHDLNSSGYWVLLYWVCLPFTFEAAHLIDLIFGIQINPFNEIVLFIGVIGLLMLAVLALKRGNPEENPWGNPNKRMQSDAAKL
jgi:uncharacterized membrane protein YhaH (DUF805 family)